MNRMPEEECKTYVLHWLLSTLAQPIWWWLQEDEQADDDDDGEGGEQGVGSEGKQHACVARVAREDESWSVEPRFWLELKQ